MNYEVMVKKYALSLDPNKVARMREESRKMALKEGRDLNWVRLLREVMDKFLAEAEGETKVAEGGVR